MGVTRVGRSARFHSSGHVCWWDCAGKVLVVSNPGMFGTRNGFEKLKNYPKHTFRP